jgi:hypothetical protein
VGFNLDDYEKELEHICSLIAYMAELLLESEELTDDQTIALLPTAYALYQEKQSYGL